MSGKFLILGTSTTDCQAGWSAFDGNCYKYFSEEKSWEAAEEKRDVIAVAIEKKAVVKREAVGKDGAKREKRGT